jgi:hypothetical protein
MSRDRVLLRPAPDILQRLLQQFRAHTGGTTARVDKHGFQSIIEAAGAAELFATRLYSVFCALDVDGCGLVSLRCCAESERVAIGTAQRGSGEGNELLAILLPLAVSQVDFRVFLGGLATSVFRDYFQAATCAWAWGVGRLCVYVRAPHRCCWGLCASLLPSVCFHLFDMDGNGHLSLDELSDVLAVTAFRSLHSQRARVTQFMLAAGRHVSGGEVSLEEFNRAVSSDPTMLQWLLRRSTTVRASPSPVDSTASGAAGVAASSGGSGGLAAAVGAAAAAAAAAAGSGGGGGGGDGGGDLERPRKRLRKRSM